MVDKIIIGDLFESGAQTLINTVNCVGVMGKGIALEFKKRFPEMFKDYQYQCNQDEVKPGRPYLYKTLFPPMIINFPTKKDWRSVTRIKDIQEGLDHLLHHYKEWGIESMAMPPLGCGNGQLDWRDVGPIIYQSLKSIDIPVTLYAPFGTPKKYLDREYLDSKMPNGYFKHRDANGYNPAWLALVEILFQLEKQPYRLPVGRTIFNKISYFATENQLPTKFQFREGSYGPFSSEVKQAITILANDGLISETQNGSMFQIHVGPNYPAVRENKKNILEIYENIIFRTVDLFARMNTETAEIAATILHSRKMLSERKMDPVTECDILEYVMEWKKRRRPPYQAEKIASAIRNLAALKWLDVQFCESLPVRDEI
ncbi:macro domain-containing protein [bacterium]|nr:macro domain-containing protein [bacterium]